MPGKYSLKTFCPLRREGGIGTKFQWECTSDKFSGQKHLPDDSDNMKTLFATRAYATIIRYRMIFKTKFAKGICARNS